MPDSAKLRANNIGITMFPHFVHNKRKDLTLSSFLMFAKNGSCWRHNHLFQGHPHSWMSKSTLIDSVIMPLLLLKTFRPSVHDTRYKSRTCWKKHISQQAAAFLAMAACCTAGGFCATSGSIPLQINCQHWQAGLQSLPCEKSSYKWRSPTQSVEGQQEGVVKE